MNKTNKDVLTLIKTKEDLVLLEEAIDRVYGALYTKSFKTKLRGIVSKELFDILEKDFSKMGWELKQTRNYLEKLKEQLSKIDIAEITLAFKPSEEFLSTLSMWTGNNLGKNTIPDIVVDPNIIAGLRITYQGRLKDFSFRNLLKDAMKSEKERILACLA
jgi:hypothetical protein